MFNYPTEYTVPCQTCSVLSNSFLRLESRDTGVQFSILFLQKVEAATLPLRCQCIHSMNGLNPKAIKSFQIFPRTAHCSRTEIILMVQQGHEEREVCLNPESRQGKRLQKCWESTQKNPNKRKDCFKRKARKDSKKKKGRKNV
ncbi:C-X-C motif chemokine 6-like isoform X2 [Stegostoma tigrinum]|uniref:C-X-C motif chemokine 6-like isoform X2 n=1 Tax=Stegostoma tigrinum TaxID=3053191 RepID=UPI00202B1F18|nr:C-X-C motif chemokine 6-like isoform X2 [Stegostoma tigrinum]